MVFDVAAAAAATAAMSHNTNNTYMSLFAWTSIYFICHLIELTCNSVFSRSLSLTPCSATGNNSRTKLDSRQWRLRYWIGLHCSWRCNFRRKWSDALLEYVRTQTHTHAKRIFSFSHDLNEQSVPLVSVHCRLEMRLLPCTINFMEAQFPRWWWVLQVWLVLAVCVCGRIRKLKQNDTNSIQWLRPFDFIFWLYLSFVLLSLSSPLSLLYISIATWYNADDVVSKFILARSNRSPFDAVKRWPIHTNHTEFPDIGFRQL